MADSKIGVGGTIGIVVGITAILGLGLYLILRPKSSSAATIPPPTNNAEVELLKAQLAALKAQQSNMNLSQQQRDANQAQMESIGIALGGKVLSAGVDKLIDLWNKPKTGTSVYGNTSLASGVPDGFVLDNPTGTVGRYDYLNPWSQTTFRAI